MNVKWLRNLPLSENIATKFTAIPIYMWDTSEQVVFCPSRVSKPRVMGVRSWFTLWRSNWNLRQSGPGSRYFQIDFVWFHSAMESLRRNEKTHRSRIKFDTPWCQTALNRVEAARDAASMNWEWWEACCPGNLDATLIFFFLELFLQMMCRIITMWKVSGYGRDDGHHL